VSEYPLPQRIAFLGDYLPRMCGTQNKIHHVRILLHNLRQRFDGMFDALTGPNQSEGEKNLATGNPELFFVETGFNKRQIGDAMRDNIDLFIGNSVDIP